MAPATELSKTVCILAIETTCDETSAALIECPWPVVASLDGPLPVPKCLSNVVTSQIDLHGPFGMSPHLTGI
jgi:tRNA A37 threonylcarbamoyltransferase TsaD